MTERNKGIGMPRTSAYFEYTLTRQGDGSYKASTDGGFERPEVVAGVEALAKSVCDSVEHVGLGKIKVRVDVAP